MLLRFSRFFLWLCSTYIWVSQAALVVKNLPDNAGYATNTGVIPGLGRSPGGGHGNPLQYSCLENLMDRRVWRATVHGLHRVGHDWAQSHKNSISICLCIYIYLLISTPHLLYSINCWWTLKMLPHLGYCKQCCNEYWGACIFCTEWGIWPIFYNNFKWSVMYKNIDSLCGIS